LLDFADQLNVVYFNDPMRMRRIVGQVAGDVDSDGTGDP
jgi:hypothetical protein